MNLGLLRANAVAAVLLLSACATRQDGPAPATEGVELYPDRIPMPDLGTVPERPAAAPEPFVMPSPNPLREPHRDLGRESSPPASSNRAVAVLVERSSRQAGGGDLQSAVVSMERALRIDPRNAALWSRLAELRLQQGKTGLAADLAAKSNSLAGGDIRLKQRNWRLIAEARARRGDADGAAAALRKADSYP